MKNILKTLALAVVLAVVLIPSSLFAREHVHTYPLKLTAADKLTDGPTGDPIKISGDTMLIWVDRQPEAKFAHATLYVLIGGKLSRIEKGGWWPVLNGKRILYGAPRNYTVVSPFTLPKSRIQQEIHVHMYPVTLTPKDKLTDGPTANAIKIPGDTMLIWVDLQPNMRFAHPTLHVLISGKASTIIKGQWWPVLNGRRILSGAPSNYTVVSPFVKESGGSPIPLKKSPPTPQD